MASARHHFKTIDEYINMFPEDVQRILHELKQTIKEAAPEAEETINYQMPTFTLNGNPVHFAAFKNHIGFYPTPVVWKPSRKSCLPISVRKALSSFRLMSRSRCR
jgi:uncharacterized protein YdhG (YjbR/CyaY superfamily)